MELQGVERAAPALPGARASTAPAPHVRPTGTDRTAPAQTHDMDSRSEEQAGHAGSNVGIPSALDAAHPRIRLDERIQQLVAQIVDENDVVVRQIPPEEQVLLTLRTRQVQGILFDKRI